MSRDEQQMHHYIAGYFDAVENCARIAQSLIVLRFQDQQIADATYDIISRTGETDALKKQKESA